LLNSGRLPELRRKSTGFLERCKPKARKIFGFCFHSFRFLSLIFNNQLTVKSNRSTPLAAHLFPYPEYHAGFP
jgi:hypothetical protein